MDSENRRTSRRNRGMLLSTHGLNRLQTAIAQIEAQRNDGNPYSAEELSALTGVSASTVRRLWSAKSGVDQKTLQQIFSAVALDLTDGDTLPPDKAESERSAQTASEGPPAAIAYRYPSGPLPVTSRLYISRSPIEDLAFREITQIGCVIRVKAPPQFGKSSLLLRSLNQAQQLGYATALIDLQQVDSETLSNSDQFLQWFSAALALKLGIDPAVQTVWNQMVGSQLSATLYVREQILAAVNRPVVLAINDITRVFEHPFTAQAFLPLLRSWYEEAGHDELWQHLRLIVTYSTDSYLPLDINYSPFNIGLPLALPEFTPAQVLTLAHRYELSWGEQDVNQLMRLIGGHPSLVHLAIYHVYRELLTLPELMQTAIASKGIYQGHLQKLLAVVQNQPELIEKLKALVMSNESIVLEPILAYQLEGTGLIKGTSQGWRISCELYRYYFQKSLFAKCNEADLL